MEAPLRRKWSGGGSVRNRAHRHCHVGSSSRRRIQSFPSESLELGIRVRSPLTQSYLHWSQQASALAAPLVIHGIHAETAAANATLTAGAVLRVCSSRRPLSAGLGLQGKAGAAAAAPGAAACHSGGCTRCALTKNSSSLVCSPTLEKGSCEARHPH
jgi:hypothetical protein